MGKRPYQCLILPETRWYRHALTIVVWLLISTFAWDPALAKSKKKKEKVPLKPKIELTQDQIAKLEKEAETGNKGLKARRKLAEYYHSKNDHNKLIDILSPVSDALDREATLWLSTSYHQQKLYINEVRVLEGWMSRQEKDYVVLKNLGDAYLALEKREEAIKMYQMSIAVNSKYIPAYMVLLDLFVEELNYEEARSLTLELVSQFGEKADYMHRLCEYYYSEGYLKEARVYCQKAVNKDPKFADSHVILGMTYKQEERPDRYQKVLKNAAKQFPRSELAQYHAGEMSEEAKNIFEAFKYYKSATKADAESVRSLIKVGETGVAIKKYQDSYEAFTKACSIDRSRALEPFRTALAQLRKTAVNVWYDKFDTAIQKCKYENQKTVAKKVKDFRVRETATALDPTQVQASPAPSGAPPAEATPSMGESQIPQETTPPSDVSVPTGPMDSNEL